MKYLFILVISLSLISCTNFNSKTSGFSEENKLHFSIDTIGEGTYLLSVNRPFVGSNQLEKYCLYPQAQEPPKLDGVTHFIPIPVKRTVITSTTHLGFLEPINQLKSIAGATNLSLFYSSSFQQKVADGEIQSLGRARINEEQLVELSPDVVFSFAVDAAEMKKVEQVRKLGQKVILVAEYMEQHPLEKAAWINFIAIFFDAHTIHQADSFYRAVENNYNAIKKMVSSVENTPTVMIGYPWKGNWYVSGGKSFQAAYIAAANSKYTWSHLNQVGSIPLATETVINDALEADYWINCGDKQELAALSKNDHRFDAFKAVKLKQVYNNYNRSNEFGANDYWESGAVRPDLILSDLIKIMHPELLISHDLVYYSQLN